MRKLYCLSLFFSLLTSVPSYSSVCTTDGYFCDGDEVLLYDQETYAYRGVVQDVYRDGSIEVKWIGGAGLPGQVNASKLLKKITCTPAYEVCEGDKVLFKSTKETGTVLGVYSRSGIPSRVVVSWDNSRGNYTRQYAFDDSRVSFSGTPADRAKAHPVVVEQKKEAGNPWGSKNTKVCSEEEDKNSATQKFQKALGVMIPGEIEPLQSLDQLTPGTQIEIFDSKGNTIQARIE